MDDNDKKVASPASSNTAQLWTEKYRQSLGYFVDLSGLAPLSNIKFRIVWEDELLKREIVREEGIHFSDSWAIELDEISGNSTRVTVTEKLMFYTTIYVYHILDHVAKSVCPHVAKPIQLIKKTIVPIVCICNDINA
ncbi:hypothetical protein GLOIN_2v1475596 [Rhizophagus irregularis DAOM 181602=DAOM 197198]|uniref:Uncharacterized protein n=1 Tax=Rhizophagus irregularis (strain DAOM 181602 / DAOM 197198 / MUCL 43194) TaxID=747089 RepID=A0A2P4QC86_RHIID|nr:hypothetical protein GLOIN_2v1475596 [Rhizophagus irregularis DAOM 181602=DAOM 197198]POG75253.1 hypothetical protein GLOIN_2v1475596 [Rhizophagus irregularis DAOM 181602=DAOM 197198]|eukprot:XP_025182119.1 hypothetical protein GLOIN_2v1475596 [Rhizophagus irregularis DAOM 181602=DAOM 197198]